MLAEVSPVNSVDDLESSNGINNASTTNAKSMNQASIRIKKETRGGFGMASIEEEVPRLRRQQLQWRASNLPRTRLSDFVEAMVIEQLEQTGFADVVPTITVRMVSNSDNHVEVPEPIVQNMYCQWYEAAPISRVSTKVSFTVPNDRWRGYCALLPLRSGIRQ